MDYQRVYKRGCRSVGRFIVLFAVPRDGAAEVASRLGVIASRKIGHAVTRSRAKRRLRELFRLDFRDSMDIPVDLVINARWGCTEAPWCELRTEFHNCLEDLRVRLEERFASSGGTNGGSHHFFHRRADSSRPVRFMPPRQFQDTVY